MAEKNLDQAPIWDDLTTFNGTAWRGKVDCITAGFPCQPFSAAGKQLGIEDDRWIWPAIKRIILDVEPSFVFLENVPQLVRGGLAFVLSDLAQLGFNAEWGLYSAAEVGAPHKRDRFWLLAHSTSNQPRQLGNTTSSEPQQEHRPIVWGDTASDGLRLQQRPAVADTNSKQNNRNRVQLKEQGQQTVFARGSEPVEQQSDVGDTSGTRRPEITRSVPSQQDQTIRREQGASDLVIDSASETMADTAGGRVCEVRRDDRGDGDQATDIRPSRDAVSSNSHSQWPPTRDGDWAGYISQGGPKPSIRRGSDGAPKGLADALHLGGNGLVPAVAAAAFIELLNRHQH
jgi:DNA (cytosine-5)-methyltransferase 1